MAKKNSLPVMVSPAKATKEQAQEQRRWMVEDALRTVNRAEEIRGDKDLMKDVKALAKEQMNNLKRIAK